MTTDMDKVSVRDRIINTACDLFYRQGFRATGINQVIAESGVAKASFYVHFKSKDDLQVEYVRETSRREMADLRKEVAAFPSAADRLYAPFRILVPWFEATGYRGCPFQNVIAEITPTDTDIQRMLKRHREQELAFFTELIEDYVAEAGGHESLDIKATAEVYLLLFEGAMAAATSYRALWPVERAEATLRQSIGLADAG